MRIGSEVLKITTTLVLVYLVVKNYRGATAVIREAGASYGGGVRALQGR